MAYTLEWDKTGEHWFENGVRNCVLYPMTKSVSGSTSKTYDDGVVWNGITTITETPDGAEANDLYADDVKYATLRSTETFGGTIEAYTYPDEWNQCDGSGSPVDGVYLGQQSRAAFGLCYRTNVGNDQAFDADDDVYKLHIIYNATASPSERSYETINDSPDAITFSWEYTTTPVTVGTIEGSSYKPVSSIIIDTSKLDSTGKTNLEKLLAVLYGNGTTAAALPTPAEVVAYIKSGSVSA